MSNNAVVPVPPEWAKNAFITQDNYAAMYRESVENPDQFWAKEAEKFLWHKRWDKVKETSFLISSPRLRGELEGGDTKAHPHPQAGEWKTKYPYSNTSSTNNQ